MEFLLMLFLSLLYIALLIYPFFGLIQVLDGIYLYSLKGQSPEYYRPLKKYLQMTSIYILAAVILFGTPIREFILEYFSALPTMYFLIVPLPIAIYKWKVTKRLRLIMPNNQDIIDSYADEQTEIKK